MILGSCGYGATGSSVLTDILSEYENIQVFDSFEFVFSYIVDGLEDLEYHIMKQYSKGESCDIAIRRFLKRAKCYKTPFINKPINGKKFYEYCKEFADEITQFSFRGLYSADMYTGSSIRDFFAFLSKKILMPKFFEKITKKQVFFWPCHKIRFAVEPDNFYIAARKMINKILHDMGADFNKIICLDQPFSGNNPEGSFPFFDNPVAIVIDRDPRDLYLAAKYTKDPNYKFCPKGDVEKFVEYYKCLRKHKSSSEKVIYINFEDFIYNYDKTIQMIEEKLELGEKVNKKIFDPSKSINNTQLIRLHPNDIDDIHYIEKELKEYLYHFEEYKNIKFEGTPFDGSAKKMFKQ